jgi:Skp family chaperone for outer membrane proteins
MQSVKRLFYFVAAFAVVLSLSSSKSFAQKIGVVDGQKVLTSYSEYTAAQNKIQAIIKSWQDTMAMMQKNLQDKFDNYQKANETMAKDAKAKAEDEIRKMQSEVQNYNNVKTNQQNGEIIKVQNDLLRGPVDKAKEAIASTAKAKKIEIVLDRGTQTTWVDPKVTDITDDVIKALK